MSNIVPKLRQFYCTPLRDMARLRLSGRLDWKTMIVESGLPLPIRDLITQVVRKSWLHRREKASVAEELIAHFDDGRRAGQSCEQLVGDFGDPKPVAKLIRRGKLRNRPLWIVMARLLAASCALMFAGLIGIWVYFFLAEARPSVNYVAQLNAANINVGKEKKAWPIYRQAWRKYAVSETNTADWVFEDVRPGDEKWPKVVEFLNAKSGLLNSLRFAGEFPIFGLELKSEMYEYDELDLAVLFPHLYELRSVGQLPSVPRSEHSEQEQIENAFVMSVLLPHVSLLRISARLIVHDTIRAIEENNSNRAVKNIQTLFGMSRQVSDIPLAICGLAALSFNDLARDLCETIIIEQPDLLSNQQLTKLMDTVAQQDIAEWFNYSGTQFGCYDIVQRMFSDDGNGNGRLTLKTLPVVGGMFLREQREEMGLVEYWRMAFVQRHQVNSMFERFFEAVDENFDKPFYVYSKSFDEVLDEIVDGANGGRFVKFFVQGSYDGLRSAMHRQVAVHEGLKIGLAIEAYRRQIGEWPNSLDQLAPVQIQELSVDPVTGDRLKYRIVDGKPVVYSVGLDLIDDGGQPLKYPLGYRSGQFSFFGPPGVTGDWVLWPNLPPIHELD